MLVVVMDGPNYIAVHMLLNFNLRKLQRSIRKLGLCEYVLFHTKYLT